MLYDDADWQHLRIWTSFFVLAEGMPQALGVTAMDDRP
jgi:hypothetical protein